jgi:hypothetical protein
MNTALALHAEAIPQYHIDRLLYDNYRADQWLVKRLPCDIFSH